ncbi:MAG: hypothetical protein HND48_15035 [Chloroflexi bacterium]|nr:hypothetical protein [Chloroflexota bacterium]
MSYKSPRRGYRREVSVTYMSGPLDGKTLTFTQPAPGEERAGDGPPRGQRNPSAV